MAQKLYTEEQVIQAMSILTNQSITWLEVLEQLTPIELPSDEEIFQKSIEIMEEWYGSGCETEIDGYFRGAKWMRDKILNK